MINEYQKIYENLKKNNPSLIEKFKNISLIAIDFDGTFTDNTCIHGILKRYDAEGKPIIEEVETISRSKTDSYAIDLLKKAKMYDKEHYENENHGIDVMILTKETSPVADINAKKTKIKCIHSLEEKLEHLKKEMQKRNLEYKNVLYMGNDYNDIEIIKFLSENGGIGVAVGDSMDLTKNCANYVTEHFGGRGAFREIVELILYSKNIHPFVKVN